MSSFDALPFPPTPSASIAGRTVQESVYAQRERPRRLPEDAPNILIVLIDDAGPGLPSTFGGEVRTDTLTRIYHEGVGYNRFHTTAMCSPTRASLLTGRNHHRIGNGQIAELANDWDGYAGEIPKSSALGGRGPAAVRLRDRGVREVAQHSGAGDRAGRAVPQLADQHRASTTSTASWPARRRSTNRIWCGTPPRSCRRRRPRRVTTSARTSPTTPSDGCTSTRRSEPDKPFFMYWASGCLHGPHHVAKEWADKYAGKFDDGWDAYRERVFHRAKEMGWIPQEAQLTPRDPRMAAWDDIPEEERPFQRRLMEVAAGFAEHVDVQVGRLVDEIDQLGYGDNTLIFYIWGDNGSSGEGQNGTISELLAQNGIPIPLSSAPAGSGRARRPRRARLPQGRQPVPRRLGLGRQLPVQGHEAARLAPGRDAQPDGRPLAGPDRSEPDSTHPVPPLQRRRAHDLRGARHHPAPSGQRGPPGPDRRRQPGLHLRPARRPGPAADPVLRGHGQPRDLPRRLDGVRVRAPSSVDARSSAKASRTGPPTRTSGSCTTSTRTGRRPTTSRPGCRTSWRR